MTSLPAQPVKGLIDGLEVLQQLSMAGHKMGGKEIARRLGLETSRVNRILKTLAHLGLAHRTPEGKYLAGPAVHILAADFLFGGGLVRESLPCLEPLTEEGLITALGMLWEDKVSYIFHHTPGMAIEEGLGKTSLFPASKSAIGLILLAQKTDEEIRRLYTDREVPGIQGGVENLVKTVQRARSVGFSEVETNFHSIAVAVGSPAFAAVAFSGNISDHDKDRLVRRLQNAAARIEQNLSQNERKGENNAADHR